ncbi:MAG TPA: hypothetical protein VII06_32845 [Chloroflexota bacterium]
MAASSHPVDQLIRELIARNRPAAPEEIARVVARLAVAPFNPDRVRVPARERGVSYRGQTLGPHEPSLVYHLVKRVMIERQWALGTSAAQYVGDLHRATRRAQTRIGLYGGRGDWLAVAIASTVDVIPVRRQGEQTLSNLLVLYSAGRGMIRTGYQFSGTSQVDVPPEVQWLK